MLKKKRLLKIASFFMVFVFSLFLHAPEAQAEYKSDKNVMLLTDKTFIINPTKEPHLVITVQYQYQVKDLQVYICKPNATPSSCMGSENISIFKDLENYENPEGPMKKSPINSSDTQETMTYVFSPGAPIAGTHIRNYTDGTYRVLVKASFCNMRNGTKTDCASESNWSTSGGDYNTLYNQTIELKGSFTGNSDVNAIIYRALEIVNNYVIPVLWILLGILLIVRGIILAIGIVKASDEAEVRSSKIKGLVWLVVGVFAGYAITIGASLVMSLFGYGGIFS